MPTTYTHDVFGKMVYQKMPENLKEIAANHINSYRIGQHGPDILFYYHLFHGNCGTLFSKMQKVLSGNGR